MAIISLRHVLAMLLLAFGLATNPPSALAQSSYIEGVPIGSDFRTPMTFTIGPQTVAGRQLVFATGEIVDGTAQAFRDFIAQNPVLGPGTLIDFHSPGGNPYEGMAMGQFIRSRSFDTNVARFSGDLALGRLGAERAGICASSCALAFLGGVDRHVPEGSRYGVHDVSASGPLPGVDLLDQGQRIAGDISRYLDRMGIDPGLLAVLSRYNSGKNEIDWMSPDDMSRLGVTTGSLTAPTDANLQLVEYRVSDTTWSLESTNDGFALEGRNRPVSDIPGNFEKLVFACVGSPRHAVLGAYYLPEERSDRPDHMGSVLFVTPSAFASHVKGYELSALVSGDKPVTSRFRDAYVPDDDIVEKAQPVGAHYVAAFVGVTPAMADLVRDAQSLTFRFYGGPLSGLDGSFSVDVTDGHDQVRSFLDNCR